MSVEHAQWFWLALGGYGLLGGVFALAFVMRGVERIDPAANGMPLAARLLLIPGSALLWPLLLAKWQRHRPPIA